VDIPLPFINPLPNTGTPALNTYGFILRSWTTLTRATTCAQPHLRTVCTFAADACCQRRGKTPLQAFSLTVWDGRTRFRLLAIHSCLSFVPHIPPAALRTHLAHCYRVGRPSHMISHTIPRRTHFAFTLPMPLPPHRAAHCSRARSSLVHAGIYADAPRTAAQWRFRDNNCFIHHLGLPFTTGWLTFCSQRSACHSARGHFSVYSPLPDYLTPNDTFA